MFLIHLFISFITVLAPCGHAIEVESATSQSWVGGIVGAGSGITYVIELEVERKGSLQITDLWIGEDHFPVKTFKKDVVGEASDVDQDDILIIKVNKQFPPEEQYRTENWGSDLPYDQAAPPCEIKGAALLMYTHKGKVKYLQIKDFEKKEPLYFQ